ncbi:AAA family ATPase [Silvimonas sp.]|uniref:AAA family ATPase n=1 Tax=Silvimonas sp. TaxID=2650811 RepID=UPI00284B0A51|nr:AAA family ATPase [Silvimonas sp.]MDR3429001.1 AAA family ATPase [Silvimonas sp.]
MKITRFYAENVHGYLPIDISFNDELNFLTGLNGSGKTSALRLIMALLTPNLIEIANINFSYASLSILNDSVELVLQATKSIDGLVLQITGVDESLIMSRTELDIVLDSKLKEEPLSKTREFAQSNATYQMILSLSTPMFLGLDRRFLVPGVPRDESDDVRRREYMARRLWPEEAGLKGVSPPVSLVEVNYLVLTSVQEIRAEQEKLDEQLRNDFFKKAFEYNPSDILGRAQPPSRNELEKYRGQFAHINSAGELKVPVPEIQEALENFFGKMNNLLDLLEKGDHEQSAGGKFKKVSAATKTTISKEYIEWIVNRPQADRVLNHLSMLNEYIERRNSLRSPIDSFLKLVNTFLVQTKKSVVVGVTGQLFVSINGDAVLRPISSLSSGERQLLIMLAHLSLNPNLKDSGVFIVDEPELSLHIDWQEKFVDAICIANPKVQFILATHSPAIILDLDSACVSMDGKIDA